jgi:hypothetical protein
MRVVILALLVSAGFCAAAPEPAVVPGPDDWTLDVRFEHPRQVVLKDAGGQPVRFWYLILSLTNDYDKDIGFYPQCELVTDTFRIVPAGLHVPPQVFEQIRLLHQGDYPFLEPLEGTSNKVLQGSDNARDIAVIWPDFDDRAKLIRIFVAGLSNESAAVEHPVAREGQEQPVHVFLRKTLELTYSLRGDTTLREGLLVVHEGKRWVMR